MIFAAVLAVVISLAAIYIGAALALMLIAGGLECLAAFLNDLFD